MAAERKTIQELIEEGRSTTESLLSHANYAEAMICSRKTLETLVQSLCRRNNLPIGDLTDMLDNLYREGVISKDVFAGFLKISMLGERAQSEGQNDPALASESFELLSQAVYAYRQMLEHQSSARRRSASRRPARRRTSGGISLDNLPPYVKIGVPLVVILLLIFLVRSFASHRKAADPTVNASGSHDRGGDQRGRSFRDYGLHHEYFSERTRDSVHKRQASHYVARRYRTRLCRIL